MDRRRMENWQESAVTDLTRDNWIQLQPPQQPVDLNRAVTRLVSSIAADTPRRSLYYLDYTFFFSVSSLFFNLFLETADAHRSFQPLSTDVGEMSTFYTGFCNVKVLNARAFSASLHTVTSVS